MGARAWLFRISLRKANVAEPDVYDVKFTLILQVFLLIKLKLIN